MENTVHNAVFPPNCSHIVCTWLVAFRGRWGWGKMGCYYQNTPDFYIRCWKKATGVYGAEGAFCTGFKGVGPQWSPQESSCNCTHYNVCVNVSSRVLADIGSYFDQLWEFCVYLTFCMWSSLLLIMVLRYLKFLIFSNCKLVILAFTFWYYYRYLYARRHECWVYRNNCMATAKRVTVLVSRAATEVHL